MDKDLKDAVLAAFKDQPEKAGETAEAEAGSALVAGAGSPGSVRGGAAAARRAAAASGEQPAPAVRAVAAVAPRSRGGGVGQGLVLVVLLVLLGLVGVLLIQVSRLRALVLEQAEQLKDYSRVTVSVYHEPGKRPQRVIAVHDVSDGRVKPGKMVISPLDE